MGIVYVHLPQRITNSTIAKMGMLFIADGEKSPTSLLTHER